MDEHEVGQDCYRIARFDQRDLRLQVVRLETNVGLETGLAA